MFKGNFSVSKKRALSTSIAIAMGLTLPGFAANSALAQEDLEEITITGSRIVRRDYQASSPIVTVDSETFDQVSTIGVEAALNQLPQFVPTDTQFTNAIETNTFATPGIASVNLRGLGSNRNLVLIDGRRAQPSNARLVVDTNSIPAAAIENVEIISGGASATYGADALGGVINFKLKRNYEGININLQTSDTAHGGGEETKASVLIGGNLEGGRGNIMLGLDYTSRETVYQRDRDFYTDAWADEGTSGGLGGIQFPRFAPGGNRPDQSVVDSIFGGGVTSSGPFYVNPDQQTVFANTGANYTGPMGPSYKIYTNGQTGEQNLVYNGDFGVASTPLERYSVFGRAVYDLNDNINFFSQVNFSEMTADTTFNYAPASSFWNTTVPRDGRALPAELEALLDARTDPAADWVLELETTMVGPRRSTNDSTVYQLMFGVQGQVFDTNWDYEAYVSHGKTTLVFNGRGFPSTERLRRLVAAPNFGQNFSATYGSGFSLTCTSGLQIFSDQAVSQDCIDGLETRLKNITTIEQDIAEINLTGTLFELPAGEVGAAFGFSTRDNSFGYNPDDILDQQSITDGPAGLFASNDTFGSTSVDEIYGEALVPVLKDIPGIQELNLEVGARYSDYEYGGEIWTYKGLLDWRINDSIRFRGGYQVANRAPNAAELFTGASQDVIQFAGADPCFSNTTNEWGNLPSNPDRAQVVQLCSDLIDAVGGNGVSEWQLHPNFPDGITGPFSFNFPWEIGVPSGNPNLENEEATTITMGVVFNPLENTTVTIDYYDIEIENAIETADARFIYLKCFNGDGSNPSYDVNNEFCQMIQRNPATGYRQQVLTPFSNVGAIETAGVDLGINSSWDLAGGLLNVNVTANFLDHYRTQINSVSPFIDSTGTLDDGGQYDWRAWTNVTYLRDDWMLGLRARFMPEIDNAAASQTPNTTLLGANAYSIYDVFGSWTVSDSVVLRGGIDNLLDTAPEIVGRDPGVNNAQGSTSAGYYDILGRRFYVGVNLNF